MTSRDLAVAERYAQRKKVSRMDKRARLSFGGPYDGARGMEVELAIGLCDDTL